MNKPLKIRGSLLACNMLLNFIGQAVPLLVGVITVPFIIQGLGNIAPAAFLAARAWVGPMVGDG